MTRSSGVPEFDLNPEIEAVCRRNNALRRLASNSVQESCGMEGTPVRGEQLPPVVDRDRVEGTRETDNNVRVGPARPEQDVEYEVDDYFPPPTPVVPRGLRGGRGR